MQHILPCVRYAFDWMHEAMAEINSGESDETHGLSV
jgi:hypothetical protein